MGEQTKTHVWVCVTELYPDPERFNSYICNMFLVFRRTSTCSIYHEPLRAIPGLSDSKAHVSLLSVRRPPAESYCNVTVYNQVRRQRTTVWQGLDLLSTITTCLIERESIKGILVYLELTNRVSLNPLHTRLSAGIHCTPDTPVCLPPSSRSGFSFIPVQFYFPELQKVTTFHWLQTTSSCYILVTK